MVGAMTMLAWPLRPARCAWSLPLCALVLCALVAAAAMPAAGLARATNGLRRQAAPRPPLGHAGRWVTDATGRVVILHGVNMVNKRPPYAPAAAGFGRDDAA